MREAAFAGYGKRAGPYTCTMESGERLSATFPTAREASVIALLASGLVRATSGRVFIDEFDPRVQPVHVKRLVGYVPHDAVAHEFENFEQYVTYRAALWGLAKDAATSRAHELLEKLEGVHEAFAYPLVGALLAKPRLLVLDRPQSVYARQILNAAGEATAIFSTHVSAREAEFFGSAQGAEAALV